MAQELYGGVNYVVRYDKSNILSCLLMYYRLHYPSASFSVCQECLFMANTNVLLTAKQQQRHYTVQRLKFFN
jgi:hypothetical protein